MSLQPSASTARKIVHRDLVLIIVDKPTISREAFGEFEAPQRVLWLLKTRPSQKHGAFKADRETALGCNRRPTGRMQSVIIPAIALLVSPEIVLVN